MGKILDILSRRPLRRRRFWRFVSPHRHGAGLAVLAILLALFYGYWYLTNDRRVRREATEYLARLTGGEVLIGDVKFSIFGPIEMQDVRVHVPGDDSPNPFIAAKAVRLVHDPWSMLLGRIEAREIVLVEPAVNLEYDEKRGTTNAQRLFELAARQSSPVDTAQGRLPRIRLLDSEFRSFERVGGQPILRRVYQLDIKMRPKAGGRYEVEFEEKARGDESGARGALVIDAANGTVEQPTGWVPIANLMDALPPAYVKWMQRYGLEGGIELVREGKTDVQERIFHIQLQDVSMHLFGEDSLQIADVSGQLLFDANQVTLEGIRGRIPAAGNAELRIGEGKYTGYGTESRMSIEQLEIVGMSVPDSNSHLGPLAGTVGWVREQFKPNGTFDVFLDVRRPSPGAPLEVDGNVVLADVSGEYKYFPYPVSANRRIDPNSTIRISSDGAESVDLWLRSDDASFRVRGTVPNRRRRAYEITVEAYDVPLDDALREAIPDRFAEVWEQCQPQGATDATIRIWRDEDGEQQRQIVLKPRGKASITYAGFQYRLDRIKGDITISDGVVKLPDVRGRHGQAAARISGTIGRLDAARRSADLVVEVSDVPIDKDLLAALDPNSRRMVKSLNLKGVLSRGTVRLRQSPGKQLNFRIDLNLQDGSIRPEVLPCEFSDLEGPVTIEAGKISLDGLKARRGPSRLRVSGEILRRDKVCMDLSIDANGLVFDKELRKGLRGKVLEAWDTVSPTGLADVSIRYRQNMPSMDTPVDYRIVILPKQMQLTHQDLPYTLRNVRGKILATPGKVTVEKLKAGDGNSLVELSGVFTEDANSQVARLALKATDLPVDPELLKAMPDGFASLWKGQPLDGTVDVDLEKFHIVRTKKPGDANEPVDANARPVRVALEGTASLSRLQIAGRDITALSCAFEKVLAGDVIRVSDIEGRMYGGKLAGRASIRAGDSTSYSMRVSINGVDLDKLVNARVSDPNAAVSMPGTLSGDLTMQQTIGKEDSRRATGSLQIREAKLYRVPVLLGLLQVVTLQLPGKNAFTGGKLDYQLKGEKLVLREINLSGESLSIVGSGTLDLDTEKIRMNFLGRPLGKLPGIGRDLDTLLKPFAKEIMEIKVTGTLKKPTMRTVALGSLEKAIRTLLNPDADDQ